MPLATAIVAFALSTGLVRLLASETLARLVLDIPNERSLHATPVPRTGGVGIMLAIAVAMLAFGLGPAAIVAPALLLAALFLADDVRGLPVATRFVAQFLAASAFLWSTGGYALLLWPLLLVGIVWSANLYNFMDGANGLAGGMAVIGFGAYALAAYAAGNSDLAVLSAAVAGAAAGFLVWNFDPARIFLGDAGSIPLGFLAATIGVLGWHREIWPFWFPALVFSVFILDSGLTLAKRVIHGESPFQAHRSHYYQRLVRMGWSHRRLALKAYGLMAATAVTALVLRTASAWLVVPVLMLWCVALAAIAVAVDRRWRASPVRGQ